MLLYQPDEGYCYNSDSIFLYGFISRFAPKGKVLDAGTGCGIVGLLVARDFPAVTLEGSEKQSVYAEFARRNARVNHIPYTLHEGIFWNSALTGRTTGSSRTRRFTMRGCRVPSIRCSIRPVTMFISPSSRLLQKFRNYSNQAAKRRFVTMRASLRSCAVRVKVQD